MNPVTAVPTDIETIVDVFIFVLLMQVWICEGATGQNAVSQQSEMYQVNAT